VYLNLVEGLLWVQDVEGSNPFTPTILAALTEPAAAILGNIMSNRALWDVRKRHVWLSNPAKPAHTKLRTRKRCGLQAAMDRRAAKAGAAGEQSES
jgi:hypothetical protein